MVLNNLIEESRIAIQRDLDSKKLQSDRRNLGQFATPHNLATEILQYAFLKLCNDKIQFLDPGFGTGSFYSALLNVFEREKIEKAVGIEIDENYWEAAINLWDQEPPLELIKGDFTRMNLPSCEQDRFNLIICNPPYVRHHALACEEKKRLAKSAEEIVGILPSGYTGLYCYFLFLSHAWMAKNALAGWLIPSEFMDVNYGRQVKKYLLTKVTLLRIHRFDPSETQFDDALVSSAVVWIKNSPPTSDHEVEFTYGGTLTAPAISRKVSIVNLTHINKWSGLSQNGVPKAVKQSETLEQYFTIKRGIATGANDFFLLSPDKVKELAIPRQFLNEVMPPPRYLNTTRFGETENQVASKIYLLSSELPEAVIKLQYPKLWAYLQEGKAKKIHERYITSHRSPWYCQENRSPAPLLFNIMGRPDKNKPRAYRFILNKSRATATNVYLMLYPKPYLQDLLNVDDKLLEEIWHELNRIPLNDLLKEGRVYGGGLYKIEPKELRRVQCKGLVELIIKHQKENNALITALRE